MCSTRLIKLPPPVERAVPKKGVFMNCNLSCSRDHRQQCWLTSPVWSLGAAPLSPALTPHSSSPKSFLSWKCIRGWRASRIKGWSLILLETSSEWFPGGDRLPPFPSTLPPSHTQTHGHVLPQQPSLILSSSLHFSSMLLVSSCTFEKRLRGFWGGGKEKMEKMNRGTKKKKKRERKKTNLTIASGWFMMSSASLWKVLFAFIWPPHYRRRKCDPITSLATQLGSGCSAATAVGQCRLCWSMESSHRLFLCTASYWPWSPGGMHRWMVDDVKGCSRLQLVSLAWPDVPSRFSDNGRERGRETQWPVAEGQLGCQWCRWWQISDISDDSYRQIHWWSQLIK